MPSRSSRPARFRQAARTSFWTRLRDFQTYHPTIPQANRKATTKQLLSTKRYMTNLPSIRRCLSSRVLFQTPSHYSPPDRGFASAFTIVTSISRPRIPLPTRGRELQQVDIWSFTITLQGKQD